MGEIFVFILTIGDFDYARETMWGLLHLHCLAVYG